MNNSVHSSSWTLIYSTPNDSGTDIIQNWTDVSHQPFGSHPLWAAILIILVAGCLSIFTVSANLMVWVSFFMDKQLQVINNYFLLSLAVADVILGAVSMPLYTLYLLQQEWRLGPVICDIWLSIDYAASNASVMNLCIICFDRYLSITRPLTYRANRTPRKVKCMIAAAWSISLIVWVPLIVGWQFFVGERNIGEGECAIQFLNDEIILNIITIFIAFYTPVSLMCVLYYRIWRETEKRARELGNLQAGGRNSHTSKHLLSSEDCGEQVNLRRSGLKARLLCCAISEMYDDELEESSDIGSTMPTATSTHLASTKSRQMQNNNIHSCASSVSKTSPRLSPVTQSKRSGQVTPESPMHDSDKSFAASLYTILIKLPGENGLNASNPNSQPKITLIEGEPINDTCTALLQDQDGSHLVPPFKRYPCQRERTGSTTSIQSQKNKPLTISTISMVNKMAARAKTNVVKRKKSALIREKKAARTLCAILSVFVITWTPYSILVLATYGQNLEEQPLLVKMFEIAYWLCYLNSTANPICYALCNANFRRAFIRILHCKWRPLRANTHTAVQQTNSSSRR